MPQYITTRQYATAARQYEAFDLIDRSRLTLDEWREGVESGAIVPTRFVDTAAALARRNDIPGPGIVVYETDTKTLKIGDGVSPPSGLSAALSGTYATLGGPLGRSKAKLVTDPANYKQVHVGDSTSDGALNASIIVRRLLGLHTQPGEALYGVASADVFTDGVGNGTTTFTSATANFQTTDVGRIVHGKNIPNGTKIASRTNSTTVVLTNTATAGTGLKFWIGRRIIAGGNNGMRLQDWFANPGGAYPYNRDQLAADSPDLTVYSWLINDIRTGGLGTTEAACVAAGIPLLQTLIDWHRATLPGDILLRMPNSLLTANVGAQNAVTDGATTNPAGQAQTYTTALRRIYNYFAGRYPNVDVLDTQAEVFGTVSAASSPLMTDQLHPSNNTTGDLSALVPTGGGYAAIADAVAKRAGVGRTGLAPDAMSRVRAEFIVYDGPSAGMVRLLNRDPYGTPGSQAPVMAGDLLYINGIDSPITLTSANVDRSYASNILQISSIGSTDFSPYIGNTAVVIGSHAPQTTGDRQVVFIDLPSIAAGATVTQDVTVAGLGGTNGSACGVIAGPPNGFPGSGLLLLGCFQNGTNTARLVIQNPTGGAIDRPGENWNFWVLR